jgi:hypothetical protein
LKHIIFACIILERGSGDFRNFFSSTHCTRPKTNHYENHQISHSFLFQDLTYNEKSKNTLKKPCFMKFLCRKKLCKIQWFLRWFFRSCACNAWKTNYENHPKLSREWYQRTLCVSRTKLRNSKRNFGTACCTNYEKIGFVFLRS